MTHSAKSRNLIIFDVDGTLVDGSIVDNSSFDRAFREVTGVGLPESLWTQFEEVTAQATIHQALGKGRADDVSPIKDRARDLFLANLRAGHALDSASLRPFPGAIELISFLKTSPEWSVAIATGCWMETAHFKLNVSGFDLTEIPFSCASERYTRAEIITLAAERAGGSIDQAIYVGDGLWDLKATQQLGIPFIGVGKRIEVLRKAGARYTLDRLDVSDLVRILNQIQDEGF